MQRPFVVVAGHPDDETIGAASLLLRAPRAVVVHLTNGAPRDRRLRPAGSDDSAAYARRRRDEALAALALAGIAPPDAICLGAVDQEAAASLAPLARELAAVFARLRPRAVVTHALEGGHPDHDAASLATRAAIALAARRDVAPPLLLEMTSYHRAGGTFTTGAFIPGTPQGRRRPLGPEARRAKRAMLDRYASQADVLAPFGVDEERFRRAGPISLAARPHPPPLHYEALGWTTFEAFRALVAGALAALGLDPGGAAAAPPGGGP